MDPNPSEISSHACRNLDSRRRKAQKIIRILEQERPLLGTKILDVGAGAGVIAAQLAERAGPPGRVDAVDLEDQRVVHEGFSFTRVEGTTLPFPDESFDIVVSNHVIEHVGDRAAQLAHLREIRRVLRDDGLAYLAVPNRWAVVEPHYGIAFLSWLPRPIADRYLRLTRSRTPYDCHPPGPIRLQRMLRAIGLRSSSAAGSAIQAMREVEEIGPAARAAALFPPRWLDLIWAVLPTFVLLLRKE
ncbi:MAG: class I SAM-dependent methyltransferase [Planctomycetaceae bacterium]|nr:MAG: class I SAM-dependent methyltransferase [Planctomycetaceae bacterium]